MYHHARHTETTKTKTKTRRRAFRPILGTVEVLTLGTNSARVTPRLERRPRADVRVKMRVNATFARCRGATARVETARARRRDDARATGATGAVTRTIVTRARRWETTESLSRGREVRVGAYAKEPATFDPLGIVDAAVGEDGTFDAVFEAATRPKATRAMSSGRGGGGGDVQMGDFFKGKLPGKIATVFALLVLSRVGTYIPISGVDRTAFAESLAGSGGMMGYVDTLTGGSISKLGIFSLGIVPYINSSIIFQLLGSVFPELKKLQKEEGEAGRRKFQQYQRYGALGFAVVQAVGQCLYVRPFVEDFTPMWLLEQSCALTAGAMILMYIGELLNEIKLGNGTSLLIFSNIVSALPSSIGQTVSIAQEKGDSTVLPVFFGAFALTALGIVYVQEAERKIPMNYSTRFNAGGLAKSSYLPFKVNSAGVMPIIFASSLLALPATLTRFTDNGAVLGVARFLSPGGGAGYVPVNVAMICFFNYFYTFLQLEPKDVADQLKRQGASIPGVRPGAATRDYITRVLERLSVLGSVFLGALALTPGAVEQVTGLQTFRGFAGTSLLILVGVATDSARKVRSELVMESYDTKLDEFYSSKPKK